MKWYRLVTVLLAFAIPAGAATLRGVVLDSQNAVIPNSIVLLRWDPVGLDGVTENVGSKQDVIATADSKGSFQLDLPSGVYDVFVTAPGFSPHCEKLTAKGRGIQSYEVHLQVSRLIKVRVN